MKVKKGVITAVILIGLGFIGAFFIKDISLTGNTTANEHVFIKTICDDGNLCQDYEIKCLGKKLISKNPIIGTEIQYRESWKDPRSKEEIEVLCK